MKVTMFNLSSTPLADLGKRPRGSPPRPSPFPCFRKKREKSQKEQSQQGKQNKSAILPSCTINPPTNHPPIHPFIHHLSIFHLSFYLLVPLCFMSIFSLACLCACLLLIYYFTFDRERPGKFFICHDSGEFQPTCAFCLSW